jgi:hypothetical protein
MTPPFLVLGLAVAAGGAAIALFVTGFWPGGLILLGVAALFFALFVEVVRRKPDTLPVQMPTEAIAQVKERAGAAVELFAVRSRAATKLMRLRRQSAVLQQRRQELLADLGAAVYAEDGMWIDDVRGELDAVDDHLRALETAMAEVSTSAQERIESARLAIQETQMVQVTPPEPDPVPTPLGPGQDD